MMRMCNRCGRGYDQALPFVCSVCGAQNHEDGTIEYDSSREACEESARRIQDYDRAEDEYFHSRT
jgi:hypothetical protein